MQVQENILEDNTEEEYEENEDYYDNELVSSLHGNKLLVLFAWFILLAVLMWPANQLHLGFMALISGMAGATIILLFFGLIIRSIKLKLARLQISGRDWAYILMGQTPPLQVEGQAQVYDTGSGEEVKQVTTQKLVTTTDTSSAPTHMPQLPLATHEEDLPNRIIEPDGMYFSDNFMPALAPMCGENVLIVGERGFGKSNLLAVAAEEIGPYKVPILFIDPLDQFSPLSDRKFFPHGFIAGHPDLARVLGSSPRNFIPVTMKNAYQVGQKLVGFNLQVVFNLKSYLSLDEATLVLCELVTGMLAWEEAHQNEDRLPAIIFFDEANLIVPQEPKEGGLTLKSVQDLAYKTFFNLVARGRNYGLSLWFATQRIQQLHKNLLQCGYKFLLRQGQKVDFEQYAVYGLDPQDILSLQVGECFIFTPLIIGFRCFMRERVSQHQGNTPGLKALKRYQETHQLSQVHAMSGEQLAGQYHDGAEKGNGSQFREQHADGFSAVQRPVSSTGYQAGSQHTPPTQSREVKTGQLLETDSQNRETEPLHINGMQVTKIQKLAYELYQKGNTTGTALAAALSADGRFGRVDNNKGYRIRGELVAKRLIQLKDE